jgi:hypothetical protein
MTEEFDFAAESAALEKQFRAGDGSALLAAIEMAFLHHQLNPEWAGVALMGILQRAADGAYASYDEAFGPPWRIGSEGANPVAEQSPKEARRRSQERLAYEAVEDEVAKQIREEGKAHRDNELFEAAAERAGVGKRTKTQDLYSASTQKKVAEFIEAQTCNTGQEEAEDPRGSEAEIAAAREEAAFATTVSLFAAGWQGDRPEDEQRRVEAQATAGLGETYHKADYVGRRAIIRSIAKSFPHIESKHLTIVEKEFADRLWVLRLSWLRNNMGFYELLWRRTRFLAGYW